MTTVTMWKDYSSGYIRNNRSSGLSVILSAFICALLLSLLCGLFYNAWKYEVERIKLEEGGWQSRISANLSQEDLERIKNFATVEDVKVASTPGGADAEAPDRTGTDASRAVPAEAEQEDARAWITAELYFYDYKYVLEDTPRIAALAGASPETIVYNYPLLAMYLIRDGKDTAPRLVFPLFILITALASSSLIVIIHSSFAVSMNARLHQFGIFSSIGATPGQIRTCLLQEAAALCALPVLAGNLLGILGSMGLMELLNLLLGNDIPGRHKVQPGYHPLVLGLTLLITAATIWISAWLPARKLSRLTPLQAIRNTGELQLRRRKNSPLLALLFGVEGELAGNALKAQRKALRTASLSLVLSFLAFTIMQCFFSLSGISTRETYFEKYQSMWDIMVTVRDASVESFPETESLQNLDGVESAVVYQRTGARRMITEEEISPDFKSLGGFSHASGPYVTETARGWLVNAPIVILDDTSFFAYCEQLGIPPRRDGAVILNQIRDVTNPDFRHPEFLPYINTPGSGEKAVSVLMRPDAPAPADRPAQDTQKGQTAPEGQTEPQGRTAQVPVLCYTRQAPPLREEYATLDYYELVHFLPASLWTQIREQIGGTQEDLRIRILGRRGITLAELNALQSRIDQLLSGKYRAESENRIQEYEADRQMIQGMIAIFGGFCVLLALIGIGNVFSNTLGFVRQRKREFARYLSVGLTPAGLRKMFCIEALVIAGRPVLIALVLAGLAVGTMLKMSYVAPWEFLREAPLVPVAVFLAGILGSVALAYFLAWRSVRRISLAEVLRDDTMM